MPEYRYYKNQQIKNTKKLVIGNKPMIRINLYGAVKGKPGKVITVPLEEYISNVSRRFVESE